MEFNELPLTWQNKIKELRRENGQLRRERNEAREALAQLALTVASR